MTMLRARLFRRLLKAAVLSLLALAALWTGHARLLSGLGHWMDVGERPLAVDYVVPLGGDVNSRPFVAAKLYRAGLAPKVVIPRPGRSAAVLRGEELAHDEIYRLVLLKSGVKQQDIIVLDGENQSTFDEAQRLRRFLAGAEPKTIAIVTSDLHTRRTRWTFRHALAGTPHELHFISAPVWDYSAENWWRSEQGFAAYPSELLKIVFYWCYYGPGMAWAGALVTCTATVTILRLKRGGSWLRRGVDPGQ
jgi:uncharacterized SAM-binding protein YcdF (DUF218 family)